jgi:hypothetical protein
MSAHTRPTIESEAVGLRTQQSSYEPYASPQTPWKEVTFAQTDNNWLVPHLVATPQTKQSRYGGFVNFYGAVSWTFGFREKYSFAFLLFFGGALVGFCLANTTMMVPANVSGKSVPGEWFWYRQPLYKPPVFIHIYLSIISGFFSVLQFIPGIRRRAVIWHRINGYLVLALLVPSTICGAIMARRSYGGELNVQSAWYFLSLMIIFSALLGIMNVKHTRKHRKWMLRTVTYTAVPIIARLAVMAANRIVSNMGTYYAIWRCDQILFVLKSNETLTQKFPQCVGDADLSTLYTAVRAGLQDGPLGRASASRVTRGMVLWVSILIHVVGVEFYIRKTENANQFRRGFVLERNDDEDGVQRRRPDDS